MAMAQIEIETPLVDVLDAERAREVIEALRHPDGTYVLKVHPSTRVIGAAAFRGFRPDCECYLDLSNVEEVQANAFFGARILRINFGTRLHTIGASAFHGTDILRIDLPDTVHTVGPNAFKMTGDPDELVFKVPRAMRRITDGAFAEMSAKKVVIHNEVTLVGHKAFYDTGIEEVVLEGEGYYVDLDAFSGSEIRTINLTRAAGIAPFAFSNCPRLQNLWLPRIPVMRGTVFDRVRPRILVIPPELVGLDRDGIQVEGDGNVGGNLIEGPHLILGTDEQIDALFYRLPMPVRKIVCETKFRDDVQSYAEWVNEMRRNEDLGLWWEAIAMHPDAPRPLRMVFNLFSIDERKRMVADPRFPRGLRREVRDKMILATRYANVLDAGSAIEVDRVTRELQANGDMVVPPRALPANRPEHRELMALTLSKFTAR